MNKPNADAVNVWLDNAAKNLRRIDRERGPADMAARAAVAQVWADMARLQYEMVRDYEAAQRARAVVGEA